MPKLPAPLQLIPQALVHLQTAAVKKAARPKAHLPAQAAHQAIQLAQQKAVQVNFQVQFLLAIVV